MPTCTSNSTPTRLAKIWLSLLFCALLSLALPLAAAQKPRVNQDTNGIAIHGHDPVAYFRAGAPRRGSSEISVSWQGATWLFENAANRDVFKAAPGKYAPEFGGYCAYAMSLGQFADTDPVAWSIVDGRLYLNYSLRVRELWRPRAAEFIDDARRFWAMLFPG